MNWHQTIEHIQDLPEYSDLIIAAYLSKDLISNIRNFENGEEFLETLELIKLHKKDALSILDVGAGNGIASISFAKLGYDVTALEPDESNIVGTKAIRWLVDYFNLKNLNIVECYAENTGLPDNSYDIIYIRQAMHHAYDLNAFMKEMNRLLKNGGIIICLRDHVILNEDDKSRFLHSHPLQKYYGGENAFTLKQYKTAFSMGNLKIIKHFTFYSSVLNFAPMTKLEFKNNIVNKERSYKSTFEKEHPIFSRLPFSYYAYKIKNGIYNPIKLFNENYFPGRIHSFLLTKKK